MKQKPDFIRITGDERSLAIANYFLNHPEEEWPLSKPFFEMLKDSYNSMTQNILYIDIYSLDIEAEKFKLFFSPGYHSKLSSQIGLTWYPKTQPLPSEITEQFLKDLQKHLENEGFDVRIYPKTTDGINEGDQPCG